MNYSLLQSIKLRFLCAITLCVFLLTVHTLSGQNTLSQNTQINIGLGFVTPLLQSGYELERSLDIRDDGLSYYENSQGVRSDVGSYSSNTGSNFSLGFYKPIKKVEGLMLGAMMRMALTGSEPSDGGYEEGFYFNFFQINLALKYYPIEKTNLYALLDFGSASVLTKNRFVNEEGEQNFFHQFGIGLGGSIGAGYSFSVFKKKDKAIELQLLYQQMRTRVEVNEVGDDQWVFGALSLNAIIVF
ncbi:MAG: hypothetical protein JXR07_15470 [Reichenbachiella sp.]